MADPIQPKREAILQHLETIIAAIRKVDGYWYDYSPDQVTRNVVTIDDEDSSNFPMVIIQAAEEEAKEGGKFKDLEDRIMQVFLLGFIKSDTPHEANEDLEKFMYDIKRVIFTDRGLNSNVTDTDLVSLRSDLGVEALPSFGVFVMELGIEYKMFYNTP